VENAQVPVIVDAGVLRNTAIARAREPLRMALAMRKAVEAGREAYPAGHMPRRLSGAASSPLSGLFL
jgi:thiazole synthase